MMGAKIIINADDLGFSPGVNMAILDAHNQGYLTHASLMANTEYFEQAVSEIIPRCKNLRVGVHINLTCAKALFEENVLTNEGWLQNNFIKLLFKRKTKEVLKSVETEIEMQILKIKSKGITISHIDGHEHIHIIPSFNKIVKKLAEKYDIERVREINESFLTSFKYNWRTATFENLIKLMLLRFLELFNKNKNKVQFYSILNTCEINKENLFDYLENADYKTLEIMLHPGITALDQNIENLDARFKEFLRSDYRTQEFELCFNKNFEKYC